MKFRFECEDNGVKTVKEIDTNHEAWSGFNGPMYQFFDFLKGCGFIFEVNDEIGVLKKDGEFHSASEDLSPSLLRKFEDFTENE